MALTVRLTARTERALNALVKRRRASRSDIVREALVHYEAHEGGAGPPGPYDSWQDVIGVVDLGGRDSRKTTGEQFTALVQKKARARRTR